MPLFILIKSFKLRYERYNQSTLFYLEGFEGFSILVLHTRIKVLVHEVTKRPVSVIGINIFRSNSQSLSI